MNKKAFFFTLLVFIFFFFVLISVTSWMRAKESIEQQDVASIRINRINEFSRMLREDAVRRTQLTGFNAMEIASAYVATNNQSKFLNNSQCLNSSCIYELMYNATLAGSQNYTAYNNITINFSSPDRMGNLTLWAWDQSMTQLADLANLNISISRQDVAVYQSDPWNVKIGYNMYVNISDRALDSVFRTDLVPVLVTIPITNYTYSTGG